MQIIAQQGKICLWLDGTNKYAVDFGDRTGQPPFFHTLDQNIAWEIFLAITDEMPDLQ